MAAFASSYIKTEASQVTRSADAASMTGTNFSSWYRQDAGTFVLTATTNTVGSPNFPRFFYVRGADTSNAISVLQFRAAGQFGANVTTNGVNQGDTAVNGLTVGSLFSGAVAYATNDVAVSFNGSAVATDTTVTLPAVTTLDISNVSGTGQAFSGYIRKLSYYNVRLTNAQLQALTS